MHNNIDKLYELLNGLDFYNDNYKNEKIKNYEQNKKIINKLLPYLLYTNYL